MQARFQYQQGSVEQMIVDKRNVVRQECCAAVDKATEECQRLFESNRKDLLMVSDVPSWHPFSFWVHNGFLNTSLYFYKSKSWFAVTVTAHSPYVVNKSVCGNLKICLNCYANAYFRSGNSVRVLSVADRDQR